MVGAPESGIQDCEVLWKTWKITEP